MACELLMRLYALICHLKETVRLDFFMSYMNPMAYVKTQNVFRMLNFNLDVWPEIKKNHSRIKTDGRIFSLLMPLNTRYPIRETGYPNRVTGYASQKTEYPFRKTCDDRFFSNF